MDVHDVSIPRPLGPGMAFTIEPGIYIREAALEAIGAWQNGRPVPGIRVTQRTTTLRMMTGPNCTVMTTPRQPAHGGNPRKRS